jgi:hypothetical protein
MLENARGPLPNFFIVGAGKAGTASLHGYLSPHPAIYMSPVKEPPSHGNPQRQHERAPSNIIRNDDSGPRATGRRNLRDEARRPVDI